MKSASPSLRALFLYASISLIISIAITVLSYTTFASDEGKKSLPLGTSLTAVQEGKEDLALSKQRYQDLQIFAKVLNLIQEYYVENVDSKKLIYGGIKGMLAELDPHTYLLPPEEYKEFESEKQGEFGGIGIEVTLQNNVLTVISPIEDTPAWEAGIKAGDKIIEINHQSTKGFSLSDASAQMRKMDSDKKVQLKVYRTGFDKPQEFLISRAVVKVKTVKPVDLEDGYYYIRITSFIDTTYPDLKKILEKQAQTTNKIKGLIIDLRSNPGGLLNQAIDVSDLFIDDGIIVSTAGRDESKKSPVYAQKSGGYSNFPIIILINESTASAAEIVAGAMQDHHRAVIMGQRSFGKGSVQSVVKLSDGSGLKMTISRYYTPKGVCIQAEGIKPDIPLDEVDIETFKKAILRKEARREQDIAHHLEAAASPGNKNITTKSSNKPSDNSYVIDKSTGSFWWADDSNNQKRTLSAKDKLLTSDFQVLQAYNHLRAWKVMREL